MALDLLCGSPTEIDLGGKSFRVGPLKLRELGELQAFVRKVVPKPTEAVKPLLEGLTADERKALLAEARAEERHWPPAIGTRAGNAPVLTTPEGQRLFLRVLIGKHQPGFSNEDAEELMGILAEEDFGVLVGLAFGDEGTDPKALREAMRAVLRAAAAAQAAAMIGGPTGGNSSTTPGPTLPTSTPTDSPN
jgi:hypothetical protein